MDTSNKLQLLKLKITSPEIEVPATASRTHSLLGIVPRPLLQAAASAMAKIA